MTITKTRARNLRKNQTDAEQKMWRHLRKKRFLGIRFRRQVAIGKYITDFLSKEMQLIIELDGSQHSENKEYDQRRTNFLNEQGYTVLRYWNVDVFESIDIVLEDIYLHAQKIKNR